MFKVMRKGDRTVPILCCDVCGSWIDDAGLGAAVFPSLGNEGDTKEVVFVHKGECHNQADAAIRAKGVEPGWQELRRYLPDVLDNSGLALEQLQQIHADDKTFGRL